MFSTAIKSHIDICRPTVKCQTQRLRVAQFSLRTCARCHSIYDQIERLMYYVEKSVHRRRRPASVPESELFFNANLKSMTRTSLYCAIYLQTIYVPYPHTSATEC